MKLFQVSFWLKLLFPIACLNCDKPEEGYLCADCFKLLSFYGEVKYLKLRHVDKIFAIGNYQDSPAPLLIHAFKFKSIEEIGVILAEFLRIFWQGRVILDTTNYLVIPLPLSKKRKRQRGFNQSEIIAHIFSSQFNYLLSTNLKRKHKKAQSSLKTNSRLKNIKNCFYFQGKDLTGKNIILLDDIITTGATINEAAKVIKEAGAKTITALAIFKA